jgi:hypothetical protein
MVSAWGCLHDEKERRKPAEARAEQERLQAEKTAEDLARQTAGHLPLTTEAWIGDVERLGIISTEVVLGMNIFKDVLANVRDIFGGRSGAVQRTS